jgi:tRNA-2-methylthio-N6-dimethylallyladenosine synthase
VREVNLLGQNVNGPDLDGGICTFAELLRLVAAIDGIDRIRYTTSHPSSSPTTSSRSTDTPEVVSFLHLPVQSGSDRILTMMKRGTPCWSTSPRSVACAPRVPTSPSVRLHRRLPGETDEDFEATMKLIEEINFDMSFSFIYSPRPGTPAADLPDDVDMEVKKARLAACSIINNQSMQIAAPCWARCSASWWKGPPRRPMSWRPHREQPGGQLRGPHTLIGGFADVEITEVRPNSLRGKFLRGENEMNLRIATAPSEILARRPDNVPDPLGVAAFTPH